MKEILNDLRLEAGISRLVNDPRLVVINKEGIIIDPLDGLEKFAELIINECIDIVKPTQEHEAWAGSYLGGEDGIELLHLKINDVKRHFGIM